MSKYATIKCWSLTDAVTDPKIITVKEPSLLLIKKSILKLGYRAFAINEREAIEKQAWYPDFLLGNEVRFYIDGSGVYRLVNCDLTESELYFERLNIPIGHKPWVFYSWQSDYNSSRSAIDEAIKEAINEINKTLNPRQELEIVSATRPEDGAKDIVDAIQDNLNKCMLAVFDITNIAQVVRKPEVKGDADKPKDEAKCYPNPNVVFELSYALAHKNPAQIVLVKKGRKKELKDDRVPFDFEHNRRLDYEKPADLKQKLKGIIVQYFRSVNYIAAE
ncbi:MAG: nucleotide-binding protein [Bacteroidia bacterium]|nr:nucleotide-binding protein [Bacteroidia bacterium]